MGIAIPTREELIANQIPFSELPKELGADSVHYLTIDGLIESVQKGAVDNFRGEDPKWQGVNRGYCSACFTGSYPVTPEAVDW